ncbi:helix-turn-helix transcriptional regulator [Sphingomonas psychrotolerans]|uniref:Helix-turn-helix transcriptional regulator n=1 Tax=Sphingomonas psychrotolerans TaxID=1327635 RepID=A0ABU3N2K8_9SPHN|nr:helix-turn-helix transcriptional regulator [Sphingomonas psychrotolerans]MDT8758788.1 helix-turn-helix transcriptional regulator [Sphingomonas psychrotolerans]
MQLSPEHSLGNYSRELVHAAIDHSSIGVAVCDRGFMVHFLNPAITQLLGSGADTSHALAILGVLGVDIDVAMAEMASQGGWGGVIGIGATDEVELYVTVEPFDGGNNAAGWLIAVRRHTARPAPVSLTDPQLIAMSGKLTAREREVMLALQEGASNKAIALRLAISPRTVEFHRARIMQRFAATSVVELVRKVSEDTKATM